MSAGPRRHGEKLSTYRDRLRAEKDREQQALAGQVVWDSLRQGTAISDGRTYARKPQVHKRKAILTEVQDNALARAARRRQHRMERPWRPYAQR